MMLQGVLFFPVTPFDAHGALAEGILADQIRFGLAHRPGAVFVAGGAGEFHALRPDEYAQAVRIATEVVAGEVPVFAGVGTNVEQAVSLAERAADGGCDGLLLFPPSPGNGSPHGLASYIDTVAERSQLPLIYYQRDRAVLTSDVAVRVTRHERMIGIKDGIGNLDMLTRTMLSVHRHSGSDVIFLNGMPTAELLVPAYRGIGVDVYSSAVFCFAPEIATAFYTSYYEGDGKLAWELLERFYSPFAALRDRVPGHGVALMKAGGRLRGLDVGTVRPPLVEPTSDDLEELDQLLELGLRIAEGTADEAPGPLSSI